MLLVAAFFLKAQSAHWNTTGGYQYTENITAELYLNGESMRNADDCQYYEIGAFVGDECRGSAMVDEAPPFSGGGYVYFMTIGSNVTQGENISFRLYNHQTEEEMYVICETVVSFESNGDLGDIFEPYPIAFIDDPTPRYNITVTPNVAAGGTVTGAGLYREGTSCTITATPNEAYNFVNWTKNGNVVTTASEYTFTVTEAADYVANFSIKTYDISVASEPQAYGSATGGGTYNYGATVNLSASPNVGYIFFNWTKDDEVVSTNANYSFTAGDGVEGLYVANFATKIFNITASVNPTNGGTVSGAGQIQEGQTCTLVATPNQAYNFVNWTKNGNVVSTNPSYSFTVTGDAAYVANFAIKTFTVTATSSNPSFGTVTGGGNFTYGQSCTLKAFVIDENLFVNWTRNGEIVSTDATYTFQVVDDTDGEYVANFAAALIHVNATANPADAGTITGTGAFPEGQNCTLTAVANTGYKFVNWTLNGVVVSSERTFTFTVTEPVNYVANFTAITNHWSYNQQMQYQCTATVELYLDDVQMRYSNDVTRYEIGAFVGEECRSSALPTVVPMYLGGGCIYNMTIYSEVQQGETITFRLYDHQAEEEVSVICNTTLQFVNMADYGDAVDPVDIEMYTDPTPRYYITTNVNPADGGTAAGAGRYREGDICTLTATANAGYSFANWTKSASPSTPKTTDINFSEQGFTNAQVITEVELDENISVAFNQGTNSNNAPKYYNTGASIRCYGGNNFVVSTTYGAIKSITLGFGSGEGSNAITTDVGEFDGDTSWEGSAASVTFTIGGTSGHRRLQTIEVTYQGNGSGGSVVSENPVYTFTVTEEATYVANFDIHTYDITVAAEPVEYGSVTGAGTYQYGQTVTLTGTPNTGYIFFNWTKNGQVVSTDATYTFTAVDGCGGEYVGHFATKIYEITATANPQAGGTIAGAGQIQEGQTCTLVATPNTGYNFVNWTKGGEVVSTNAEYSFTVVDNEAYVANFELKTYVITVSATPEGYGTATGAGTYVYGTTCTLTATPNEDFIFANWTKDGEVVSSDAEYSFTVEDGVEGEYVAQFARSLFQITATANPANGGVLTGAGAYMEGQTCTLTATANPYFKFVNWTKDGEEITTENSFTFVIEDGVEGNYVANFSEIQLHWTYFTGMQYSMTLTGELFIDAESMRFNDNVTYYEIGAFVGTECRGSYLPMAVPDFLGGGFVYSMTIYSEVQQGETIKFFLYNHLTEMEEELTCTSTVPFVANNDIGDASDPFEINFVTLPSYEITIVANPEEGGEVEGAGTYLQGTEVTLTAIPNEGYIFLNWEIDDEIVSTDEEYTFVVVEDGEYIANFEIMTFEVIATADPEEGGEIEGDGIYTYGSECTLIATPNEAYNFLYWFDDAEGEIISEEAEYTFTVYDYMELVAYFELKTYEITVAANPTAGGTVEGAGTYTHGDECTLTATPDEAYNFVNWTLDGEEVSTDAEYTFAVTAAGDYVANFEIKTYDITVVANPEEGGVVEGAGTYDHGTTCTLIATPGEIYNFVNWTLDGEEVSTDAEYTFTVTADGEYVANFELKSYEITVVANPSIGGTVEGAGTYTHGDECTLIATPDEIYNFVNWTLNGEEVSTDAEYTFTVVGEGEYIANFEIKKYDVVVTLNPENAGFVLGAGTYNHGTTCTLTAQADANHAFVNWTENGEVVSINGSYSFVVTEEHNVVANFLEYHWDVNIYEFPDIMSITAVIKINNIEQTDDMLELAAFVGDECRGREKLMYIPDFDRAYLFLVVHGEQGDVFDSYRLYNHTTQEELETTCLQQIDFIPDGDMGDFDDPYVFNFGVKQIIELATGYNWFASYIEFNGINGLEMMQNALGTSAERIASQTAFTKYYPAYGYWYGSLTSVNNESMYRIVMNEPATIELEGSMANPENHPITIKNGLNHIGFISPVGIELKTAFDNMQKTNQDQLKTQTAFAKYYADYDTWYGGIGNNTILQPGKGLQYKSNNPNNVTLVYPTVSAGAKSNVVTVATNDNHWKSDYYAYPYNMTVMAVVELDEEEIASENYEIAAFANGECRGSIRLMYVEPIDRYVAFLTVAGEEVTDLNLRLYNVDTEEEYISSTNLMFTVDAELGDFDNPFVVRFGKVADDMIVYPNPVANGERINLMLSSVESVQVEIINSLGTVVSAMTTTGSEIRMDVPSTPGVYTIRVITDGKNIKCRKLIVK